MKNDNFIEQKRELFTPGEFAQMIGFSPSTVRKWAVDGLSPVKFRKIGHGRRWVTTRSEIERWLKSQSERRDKTISEFCQETENASE